MSSELVSLDDIIKKNKSKMKNNRGPKKAPLTKGAKSNGTSGRPVKGGITKKPIQDARFKIIQKKRKTITDARDKLAQIAKQSDARLKLQKIRASNPKKVDSLTTSHKTDRNGRIPSGSGKIQSTHVPRSLPPAFIAPSTRGLSYRPPPMPEHHYVNDLLLGYNDGFLLNHQAALRRTVSNDYAPVLPPPPPVFSLKPAPFDWDKPSHSNTSRNQSVRSSDRPRDYKVIPRTGMSKAPSQSFKDDWSFSSNKNRSVLQESTSPQSKYYGARNHRDGVKSRLDSPPSKSRNQSGSSRPKPNSQSTGYRIVVSNLQANVTQEDIKELFEDVGELTVSRLVRPGIAEVIYKTLKDATKAVETYHNRQLDGHPMKCLLVNPQRKTSSTSSGRVLSQSRGSGNYSQPSLGTIHRALFD